MEKVELSKKEQKRLELITEGYSKYDDYLNAIIGSICSNFKTDSDFINVYTTISDKLWYNKSKKIYCDLNQIKSRNIICSVYSYMFPKKNISNFQNIVINSNSNIKNNKIVVHTLNNIGWFYTY